MPEAKHEHIEEWDLEAIEVYRKDIIGEIGFRGFKLPERRYESLPCYFGTEDNRTIVTINAEDVANVDQIINWFRQASKVKAKVTINDATYGLVTRIELSESNMSEQAKSEHIEEWDFEAVHLYHKKVSATISFGGRNLNRNNDYTTLPCYFRDGGEDDRTTVTIDGEIATTIDQIINWFRQANGVKAKVTIDDRRYGLVTRIELSENND